MASLAQGPGTAHLDTDRKPEHRKRMTIIQTTKRCSASYYCQMLAFPNDINDKIHFYLKCVIVVTVEF